MGTGGFELLEHTADVGIRAWAATLEEAFEHATEGLAEVQGAGPGAVPRCIGAWEPVPVEVTAPTPAGCWSTG